MSNLKYVKCSQLIDVRDGTHDSPKYVDKGYLLITSKNIKDGLIDYTNVNYISKEDFDKINLRSKVDNGDILMPMIGTIGNPVIASFGNEEGFAIKNVALFKFQDNTTVYNKYFYYLLKSPTINKQLDELKRGGTQSFVSLSNLRNLKIPVFNIETQRSIASILDKSQELINKRKAQIEALDQFIQSVFLEMFGDIDNNFKEWDVKLLEDLSTKITDGVHSKPEYTSEGIPFISVKDINTGILKFDDCKYISHEAHENYIKRCKPEREDILYTKVGTYGIPAIVDDDREFSIYVSVSLIKPRHDIINNKYLKEALRSYWIKRQADRAIKGIGVPDLHLIEIRKFKVLLPPIELQNKFACIVQKTEAQKALLQQSLIELEKNFNSLMQRAFKGELFN